MNIKIKPGILITVSNEWNNRQPYPRQVTIPTTAIKFIIRSSNDPFGSCKFVGAFSKEGYPVEIPIEFVSPYTPIEEPIKEPVEEPVVQVHTPKREYIELWYRQHSLKRQTDCNFLGTAQISKLIDEEFGNLPYTMYPKDIPKLALLSWETQGEKSQVCEQLIELISNNRGVYVFEHWGERERSSSNEV